MMRRKLIAALLLVLSLGANAQEKTLTDAPNYPQDYFRNPLDIPIFLAGNFGECRPGHFHSGVDIKTLGKENQPVHAAADGYISRIKMEKGGFGHGLYITHPNGYTTLYAHLNDFAPAIQEYLKKEQYEKKHWDVDIQLTPDQFPVKKGQQIAWSGNTGASTAPHLHFEIRDTKTEHPLNPELFGLPVVDKIAPVPAEIIIYGPNVYATNFYEAGRKSLKLEKKDSVYILAKTEKDYLVKNDTLLFQTIGNIGIGVNVDDHMDGSDNTIAFYTMKLYEDDSLQASIMLDNIGYEETRYINAYSDYKIKQQENKWVQCLFKLPGNHLDHIYSYLNNSNGVLQCCNTEKHKIEILIADDKGNQSRVVFYITHAKEDLALTNGWQQAGSKPIIFKVNSVNTYNDSAVGLMLDGNALYDNITFMAKTIKYQDGYSDKHQLHYPYVPVHSAFDLKIKPDKTIPPALSTKVVMMYSDDKDEDGRAAAQTDNGWYKARVRSFGAYWLDVDTTAPTIKSEQKNNANLSKAKQITFEVKDNKTSVKKFSGYLDGKWLCFEQHGNSFFYKFDNHCAKGKHQLVFAAEDENGNSRSYHLDFTR